MDADTHGLPPAELRSVFGFNGEEAAGARVTFRFLGEVCRSLCVSNTHIRLRALGPERPPRRGAPDLPPGIDGGFEGHQRWRPGAPAGTHQRRLLHVGVQERLVAGLWTGGLHGLQGKTPSAHLHMRKPPFHPHFNVKLGCNNSLGLPTTEKLWPAAAPRGKGGGAGLLP